MLRYRGGSLSLARVRVMGILNVTPDSFYDRGRYWDRDTALRRAAEMVAEGADIIDVGGEKAGPGEAVGVEEEIERVAPVVAALRQELPVPVSVDTFKPEVARAAIEAGAGIVNSIGGLSDREMRRVVREMDAAAVIMHIQGEPRVANPTPVYGDVVSEIAAWLLDRATLCVNDGIPTDHLLLDPGPGFGKTADHDLALLRGLARITALPYPILLAVSRKPFIGAILNAPVEDRLEGSLAVAAWGVLKGVKVIRTHDVRATVRVVRMTEAVLDPASVEVGT